MIIGFDAKRIVRNATGLGNYGRTLVNDLAAVVPDDWTLRLYAPDAGRDTLRSQVKETQRLRFVYPQHWPGGIGRSLWRIGPIADGKASAYNAGYPGSIPCLGRSPGEENGNPLQYS